MKYLLLLLAATAVLSFAHTTKEPSIYIGHAQIVNGNNDEWCVVRLIHATSQKQADSLFKPLCDSLEKYYHGSVQKITYAVWRVQPSMVLKIDNKESQ